MNYRPLLIAILLLSSVWGVYFWQFNAGYSNSQGDWGTFGDFTGGVLNPLLNFITIYILITQFKAVKDDLDSQRLSESIKSFESSFYTFTTIALDEFKKLRISYNGAQYVGAESVGFIEDYFEGACKARTLPEAFKTLDEKNHDQIYSLVAGFCVVFKLIQDSCPEEAKEKYISLFSMLLPTKVTYLLCMAECATRWKLLRYPREVGYFDKASVVKVLDYYKKLAVSDGSES